MIENFTGFVVAGHPVEISAAATGLLIALTALAWTVVQHLQIKNGLRITARISALADHLTKTETPVQPPILTEKGGVESKKVIIEN